VLAVDSSSTRTGSSILGDETRMARPSNDAHTLIDAARQAAES